MGVISLTSPSGPRVAPGRPARELSRGKLALSQSGFRPFFLLAALFACLGVPLWLLSLAGLGSPGGPLGPRAWHGHEMIFGYAAAVIAGFLLTAVEKWTGRSTISGRPLLALALLWVLGRAAWFWAGVLPPVLVAVVDVLFLPALAAVVGRAIVTARNVRNYGVVALLAGMSVANVLFHLEALGVVSGVQSTLSRAALHLVTVMTLLIGSRIVPTFTRNATRSERVRPAPAWSKSAITLMVVLTIADLVGAPPWLLASLALGTAMAAAVAARHWGTRESLSHPLLWILHAGYYWIVASLVLSFLAWAGVPVSQSASLHALTVGGIGSFTLGMMSRVTLGHTGRMIVSSRITTLSFALIGLAALCRVAVPELVPAWTMQSWRAAGALWALSFAAYLWKFAPLLVTPRIDGQPG